ncbi:hypothetical protein DEO72_LG6g1189 [Vigna unguiculata]|uniref:Uncharacterized protein n=1 Tax=Vigna unguiculata TaxID=3917 RepID=A0A4D6M5K1_VIGUN|nr:hypothetical protein DEO72_LG6g1189 [Vigna unguiculata]
MNLYVEELQGKVDKFAKERAAWKKERESWKEERKRLGTWKVRCLDSEGKLNKRITDLEANYDELKEKYEGAEGELDDLKGCIIQEHINGLLTRSRAVSYTPLDVYKRRTVDEPAPVSYTPLDVYKRRTVDEPAPVSYTPLDVYKRRTVDEPAPVSYTPLDVYKRRTVDEPAPVSYTPLDVYKRRTVDEPAPVSYTPLDVYKRRTVDEPAPVSYTPLDVTGSNLDGHKVKGRVLAFVVNCYREKHEIEAVRLGELSFVPVKLLMCVMILEHCDFQLNFVGCETRSMYDMIGKSEANSATFAQASPSRLSESCRIRLGLFDSWNSLRRAGSELGDLARGFGVLGDGHSCLGESGSPKRVIEVQW